MKHTRKCKVRIIETIRQFNKSVQKLAELNSLEITLFHQIPDKAKHVNKNVVLASTFKHPR